MRISVVLRMVVVCLALAYQPRSFAQITNTIFSESFSGPLNTNIYVPDAPTFEGGKGTITPNVSGGVVEFTGTVTEQWWAGGTLRVVPTFPANAETNAVVSVDRVMEAGVGTASRSALWIMDATRTYYVLFADVRGEGGWHYNRKIGLSGDVPTGGGPNIAAFDGGTWDDGGLHRMKAIANGTNVRLYLDDVFGVSVPFPFNNLCFQIGSYARANNDTADTVFDNFLVQTVGLEAFSPTAVTLASGQTVTVAVRIPPGVNKTQPVLVRVTSDTPTVAIPAGAVNGILALTFPAGGDNTLPITINTVGLGGAIFSLTNDVGIATANNLSVVILQGAGVRMTEDFSSPNLSTNWNFSNRSFEAGTGTFDFSQNNGQLSLFGSTDQQYWAGDSLVTTKAFTATPDLPLSFEIDRVSMDATSVFGLPDTAARTGVYITTANRARYVFFGQNVGETGWEVNVNPGNPTGSGTAIAQFASITNLTSHRMKLVADGTQVEVFLDGQSGGKFPFAATAGIYFEAGAYARDIGDGVTGVFDNVVVQNVLAPIAVAPTAIEATLGVDTSTVAITVPRFRTSAGAVTVTSRDPTVAVPQGAVNGALKLQFPAGGTNVQTFNVVTVGPGSTSFEVTNDQSWSVANSVNLTVLTAPVALLSDDFSASTIDNTKWTLDSTPMTAGGILLPASSVYPTNGVLFMDIRNGGTANDIWAGFALFTKTSYTATATSPIDFELDRTLMEYQQIGGVTTKERTGIWIKDSTTNFIFFGFFDTHDATNGGWQYNQNFGGRPLPDIGVEMPALGAASFNVLTVPHHMKVTVNGANARLYVDGVLGATVSFPYSNGITFGIGSYVNVANALGNVVRGYFDNAYVYSHPPAPAKLGPLTAVRQGANIIISWTGSGSLQSSSSLPGTWTDVTPTPTGSYTVAPAANAQKYFRLRQ